MKLNVKSYTLDGTGTEIDNFNTTDTYDEYLIKGTATGVGNYAISVTGTPQVGEFFRVKYKGELDITTNGVTFSILGQAFTQNQLNSDLDVECFYDGSAWEVQIKPSFTSAVVEAANLTTNAVTATSIANGSITEPKLATNSVSATKIQSNAVTTSKINNLAVTDAKINDVDGSKIVNDSIVTAKYQDDSVTNAKLATMTTSSLKYGNASGNPGDLALANDEIAIGNGTTIVAVSKSSLYSSMVAGDYFVVYGDVSWEAGEQNILRFWIPVNCELEQILFMTYKAIAGTDDAEIEVRRNATTIYASATLYPASTAANQQTTINFMPHESFGAGNSFNLIPTKTTAGGKAKFTALFLRT